MGQLFSWMERKLLIERAETSFLEPPLCIMQQREFLRSRARAAAEPGNGLCVLSSHQSKWAKHVNVLRWFAEGVARCGVGTVTLEKKYLVLCSLWLRAEGCQQFYDDIDFFSCHK